MNTETFRSDQAAIKTGHTEDVRLNSLESFEVRLSPNRQLSRKSEI
jgi:hypothetical protein